MERKVGFSIEFYNLGFGLRNNKFYQLSYLNIRKSYLKTIFSYQIK